MSMCSTNEVCECGLCDMCIYDCVICGDVCVCVWGGASVCSVCIVCLYVSVYGVCVCECVCDPACGVQNKVGSPPRLQAILMT